MPRNQTAAFLLTFALFFALPVQAEHASKTEDPHVGQSHATRGSQQEKELTEKRSIKTPAPAAAKLPATAEVRKTLIKGERPSVRFLLKKQAAQSKGGGYGVASHTVEKHPAPVLPQHKNKLENDKIRHPRQFEVEYTLAADADVRFTFSSLEGSAVGSNAFKAGEIGARKGKNKLIIWDGRDTQGKEAPLGEYLVTQEIEYGKDDVQQRSFSLVK